ncbi:iron-containing alcohol dehydrogenase [Microbaculum marinum]|uniref:Iron-containing alcohol dehydrogenase n=1 Tax=Microbaculum marinum TaxID=1764581 RepID=A0AAW9RRS0_9HYPH
MTGFVLSRTPSIAVGPGRCGHVGADVTGLVGEGASILLVADPGLAASGITSRALQALAGAGHRVTVFDGFTADPQEAHVTAGAALAGDTGVQVVVGLGGGSALDAAKMIAVAAVADRTVETYRLAAAPLPARSVRSICIPTTAGTGSEATAVSVLTGPDKTKYWFWGDPLKPDLVILDPELTVGLPAVLTAATGLDALVHAIEAATNRSANPANDLHARTSIDLAVRYLPRAVVNPGDIEARTNMLMAATMAGVAIDNAGTALAHNIGHALGSLMPVHHGRAVALAMEATLPWVIEGNREAFTRVAEAFGLGPAPEKLPDAFSALLDRVGFDRSLPQPLDVQVLAARMAAPENAAMLNATARPATADDIQALAGAVLRRAGQIPAAA